MADVVMRTLPFETLLDWVLTEYKETESLFGIPKAQFFLPDEEPRCSSDVYGSRLTTPIGPAAGPHTQLSQNILSAWVTGGRFIELKTVQIMDELEIPRPCIDLADEGYNVEWSQELRLAESMREYVHAWAMVHVLRRLLGLEERIPFGTIFNMSVGYNMEGILSEPMQRFMATLEDASSILEPIRGTLARYPEFADLAIPDRITNSVTLSTMHGCPPDEIERIARYLVEERGLHTTVKLNPTLLGKEAVLEILHTRLGFTGIDIPDSVFENDLRYERALELIASLQASAADRDLTFAVKLSNTLALANHRDVLPGDEMYMSGRALFPVTVALFNRLIDEFDGRLHVSYSAGGDALNVSELLAAGALPVTVASDLLKPGGYAKLGHYIEEIERTMSDAGAETLAAFAADRRTHLPALAGRATADARYHKTYSSHGLPKTATPLEAMDCIEPPCVAPCAVHQDVPEYVRAIAEEDPDRALAIILSRNPLPGATGHVCTNLCQTRCTRSNNDEPVAIRKLKRFATEHGTVDLDAAASTGRKAAIIGGGPSGLAAAYFLALSGVHATILEARERAGGMLAIAPTFRLPVAVVEEDIDRIRSLGVDIQTGVRVSQPPETLLDDGYDAVYVACGYSRDAILPIEGVDAQGVFGALDVLLAVARGEHPDLGDRVIVIGGGNTAMDAARTSQRLLGRPSTVVYRRSRAEMPAELEEVEDLLAEGNEIVELVSPVRIIAEAGRVVGLACIRNELGEPDEDGRRRPTPVADSELTIDATSIIFATGQRTDLGFLDGSGLSVRTDGGIIVQENTGRATDRPVYAGGDVARGPETIIAACADGRRAAESICGELGVTFRTVPWSPFVSSDEDALASKRARARRAPQVHTKTLPIAERSGFDLVEQTLDRAAAQAEAARCLQCSTLCNKCVEVCPNRANLGVAVEPVRVNVPIFVYDGEHLSRVAEEIVDIAQPRQIVHIEDFCNACGNCTTFCVHPGEPFRVKPRLFLTRSDYEADPDLSYFLTAGSLRRKDGGSEAVLTRREGGYSFGIGSLRATFANDGALQGAAADAPFDGRISLRQALEMMALYEGIRQSAPQILAATTSLSEGCD